jgi:hypothetical protein
VERRRRGEGEGKEESGGGVRTETEEKVDEKGNYLNRSERKGVVETK